MNPGLNELVKRAIKYLVEGLMVAIVAFVIPQKPLKFEEIAIIALMAAATFSILDTFTPSIGVGAITPSNIAFSSVWACEMLSALAAP